MSKFQEGERYRHERALDTDILVVAINKETEENIHLAVFFVAQSSGRFIAPDDIVIKKADYDKWTRIES